MLKYFLALLMILSASFAVAQDTLGGYMQDAKKVGEGRLSVVFWEVYDATLYAPGGTLDRSKPYALSIDYFRQIEGVDIADRSAHEIRQQGYGDEVKLAAWHSQMREIFPDVVRGNNLTAITYPGKHTIFIFNGKKIGTILDPDFGTQFFNIWLSEKTSEPKLRKALLGLS